MKRTLWIVPCVFLAFVLVAFVAIIFAIPQEVAITIVEDNNNSYHDTMMYLIYNETPQIKVHSLQETPYSSQYGKVSILKVNYRMRFPMAYNAERRMAQVDEWLQKLSVHTFTGFSVVDTR